MVRHLITIRVIQLFDLSRNVPNVKEMFPKQRPGAPDVLDPKFAQAIDFLLAYDIKYDVKFGNSDVKEEANIASDHGYPVLLGILGRRLCQ